MNLTNNNLIYFQTCLNHVQNTFNSSNKKIISIVVDEYTIDLIFVNEALVSKLSCAFQHILSNESNEKKLSIYILDESSSKIKFPIPPWKLNDNSNTTEIWLSDADDIKIIDQPSKSSLIMLNMKSNEAIYFIKSADQIPYYESSAPFRPILHWWMSEQGSQLLHAAAIGLPNAGILLVGKGGSGKSNTAVSTLNSELFFAGDDYCLLSFKPQPTVYSLFSTAKLHFEDNKLYPYLRDAQYIHKDTKKEDEKALYFLYPHFKNQLKKSIPIKAVFVPKISGKSQVNITPISASKAYLALAPSTIFQLHGRKEKTHENITKLLQSTPCYLIELSTDTQANTKAIFDFLNNPSTL